MATHQPDHPLGKFLPPADVAELLSVDVDVVLGLLSSGELVGIRVGEMWRVEETQLQLWIDAQYELARRGNAWQQGEFSQSFDLSEAPPRHLRPVK
ncbi:MAG TPA: helix-turn-helix domain-containing protein [Candidatus Lumbricidophila sp.]|nr:helix-turn-helix domain-containing protein [Candidatus Lumbricidophila sp.]